MTHLAGYQGLSDEGWGINSASVTTTPIPAAIWLTGSALAGLGFFPPQAEVRNRNAVRRTIGVGRIAPNGGEQIAK